MSANSYFIIAGFCALATSLSIGVPFDFTLLGINLLIGGLMGAVFEPDGFVVALSTTGILSFIYVAFARQLFLDRFNKNVQTSNADSLLGSTGQVIKPISPNQPGQIKIKGELWLAKSEEEIEVGRSAYVERVEGAGVWVREKK